jgi:hypothetical protein
MDPTNKITHNTTINNIGKLADLDFHISQLSSLNLEVYGDGNMRMGVGVPLSILATCFVPNSSRIINTVSKRKKRVITQPLTKDPE